MTGQPAEHLARIREEHALVDPPRQVGRGPHSPARRAALHLRPDTGGAGRSDPGMPTGCASTDETAGHQT